MKLRAYADGDIERAKQRYTDPDIEWDDTPWSEENPPKPDSYDLIILDHLLQTGPIHQSRKVVSYYADMLKEGGRIIVVVPAMEWAVNEIAAKDNFCYSAYAALYGFPGKEVYQSGYTLHGLRSMIETIPDMDIVLANSEAYVVYINGQSETPMQNIVIATKHSRSPSEAIA